MPELTILAMTGIIVISTFPDRNSAEKIARHALDKREAACVNLLAAESLYRWRGKLEHVVEFLAFFKTTKSKVAPLKESILKAHPYEVPEIVEIKMDSTSRNYLGWLNESVKG